MAPPANSIVVGAQDIAHQAAAAHVSSPTFPSERMPDLTIPISDGSGPKKGKAKPRKPKSSRSSGGNRRASLGATKEDRRARRRSSSFGSTNSFESFERLVGGSSDDDLEADGGGFHDSRGSHGSLSSSQSQSNKVISALEETMAEFDPSWAAKQQRMRQMDEQQQGSSRYHSSIGGGDMPVPLYDFDDVYNELKASQPTGGGLFSTITNALGNLTREIGDSFRLSSRNGIDQNKEDLHFDINIAPKRRGSESSCGSNPMGYSEAVERLTSSSVKGPRRGRKPQKAKAFSYGGADGYDDDNDDRFWCCREVGYTLSRHKTALLVGFAVVMAGLAIATMVAAFGHSQPRGGVESSVAQPERPPKNDKSGPTPELLDIEELPTGDTFDGISVIHPAVPDDPAQAKRMGLIYQRIVQSGLSYPSDLDNELSAQYKALRWISLVDEAQLHHEHHGLLQRYSLAVLFFATFLSEDVAYAEDVQNLKPLSVQGEGWKDRTNWMTEKGHCAWKGVQCHQQNGAFTSTVFNGNAGITALNLTANNLMGSVPREIQGLGDLRTLDLGDNLLEGSLPFEIGHLSQLEILAFDGNGIDDTLPKTLGRLTKAREIHLSKNYIAGTIPASLSDLTNLRSLSLYRNALFCTIPNFTGLTNLRAVYLDSNYLSGVIPESLADIRALVALGIGDNELTGTLPLRLCELKNLSLLRTEENFLEGEIMDCIGKMTSLEELHLHRNRLQGTIPASIGDLSSLELLYVDSNELVGTLPSSIGKLSNLRSFYAQNNNLSGQIPKELSTLNQLQRLYLNGNDLEGESPPELGALTRLEKLRLQENDLSGHIPIPVCMLEDHSLIDLQGDCGVSGKIECECCTACH